MVHGLGIVLDPLDCKNQPGLANARRIVHIGVAAMPMTVECPSCGTKYRFDEKYAGRTFSCKRCSSAIQASAEEAPEAATPVLRFKCENCGKGYKISSEHAGKKTVCSDCGTEFRIPWGDSPAAANKSAQRSKPTPAELDVYGLEDEPPASAGGAARVPGSGNTVQLDSTSAEPGAVVPRRDYYKPLSEKQKKKINKRADKLNLLKPTNASVGISFGAVIAIALFGWRMYRIMHRFERAAARANAAQSAPEDFQIDFKTFVAENDKETEQTIARDSAEARDWLDQGKHPNHRVMEMPAETARTMVAGFYERGAQGVYVLEPSKEGEVVMASEFAVKLPQDAAQRQKCLEWAAQYEGGGAPSPDHGQKYVIISTDD
jgi:hypothetical protein